MLPASNPAPYGDKAFEGIPRNLRSLRVTPRLVGNINNDLRSGFARRRILDSRLALGNGENPVDDRLDHALRD